MACWTPVPGWDFPRQGPQPLLCTKIPPTFKTPTEVARLPVQEREIVDLIYYHGWTQAQAAELFHVNVRTVRRWWESALVKLHRAMNDEDESGSQS